MQPISDKELDKLFQEHFDGFEIEPSALAWNKIEDKLNSSARNKKIIPVFWTAAASVIIILGVAFWLFNPKEKIPLRGKVNQQLVKQTDTMSSSVSSEVKEEETIQPESGIVQIVSSKKNLSLRSITNSGSKQVKKEKIKQELSPVQMALRKPIPIGTNQPEEVKSISTEPALVNNSTEPGIKGESELSAHRHKIRNLGGLMNYVIAKVDKRDEKIIQFEDNDEGSVVSGINLGLIKLKSRNK